MVTEQALADLAAGIADRFRPERVVLFGSYAYGTPTEDSDVDLLVVMPYKGTQLGQAVEIAQHFAPPFSLDVIVRSGQGIESRVAMKDRFITGILARGRVLYAADSH